VSQLHIAGAKVIHGDWDEEGGRQVDALLSSPDIQFVKTDVTDYDSLLHLFDVAWKKYGRVDVAISNAGIQEIGNWFDPELDIESVKTVSSPNSFVSFFLLFTWPMFLLIHVKQKPPTRVLDVNLVGTLYFSRIAAVYLRTNAHPSDDKSLVLISSAAGFKDTPGLFAYTASKHGVLGLLRSLRPYLHKTHNVRVNAICPWMTDTAMVKGIRENWMIEGLPVNKPGDVGRVVLEVAVGLRDGKAMEEEGERWNGRAVFVEGGRGWDIEEGINATEPIWLGEQLSRMLARGQEVLGDGTDWTKPEAKH
jgi:NAD(P)-dependent dehydrogenase (short-subunit alcohol dehydrogenase family)